MRAIGTPDGGGAQGWSEDPAREGGYGAPRDPGTEGGRTGTNLRDGQRPRPGAAENARRAQFETALAREDARSRAAPRETPRREADDTEATLAALSGGAGGAQVSLAAPDASAPPGPATPAVEARIAAIAQRVDQAVREELFLRAGETVSLRVPLAGLSSVVDAVTIAVTARAVDVSVTWLGEIAALPRQEALEALQAQLQGRFAGRRVVVSDRPDSRDGDADAEGGLPALSALFRASGERG